MGVKVWPARGRVVPMLCPPNLIGEKSIQTTLQALPIGTKFHTILRFHNLRPVELGALLWGLSFGKEEAWTEGAAIALRHRLGMGKPYGLGEIAVRLNARSLTLESNAPLSASWEIGSLVREFTREMSYSIQDWRNTKQLRTLLAAADPVSGAAPAVQLYYMNLNPKVRKGDDFLAAKVAGQFLPDYMIAPQAAALAPGVRVQMNTMGATGVIKEVFANARPPECLVLLENSNRPVRYRTTLFTVID